MKKSIVVFDGHNRY